MKPLSERRMMIDAGDVDFNISVQCDMLQVSRSGFYYQPVAISSTKLAVMKEMDKMYIEVPTRGTRRYAAELSDLGFSIGQDGVRSLMRIMGITAIYRKPRTTVIDPTKYKYPYLLKGLKIERINQVWGIDISFIPMRNGFMYLTAIIDLYSRFVVGWSISNTMEASRVVRTHKNAIKKHGKPEIINSDQRSQFTSEEYLNFVKSQETILISMDRKGRAIDNIYRTIFQND
jgi:putative transposase